MANTQLQVARALLEIDAVGFKPNAPITFKSGIISPVYVDNRTLPYHPQQWQVVIEGFQALIAENNFDYDIIAGIALGGVPHCSALAYTLKKPTVLVRKEAKSHGKSQRIEGGDVTDKRVLLVEDLVTMGGSSLSGVGALRDSGAIMNDCLVIVSYGFAEAREAFSQAKINLHTLTTFDMILEVALEMGKFTQNEMYTLQDWFADPHGWAQRQGHK